MKTPVFPAPNGIPASRGAIQWIDAGAQVHANQSSPMGITAAQMQTKETAASGGGLPVSGSGLWRFIKRRISGSQAIVRRTPMPIPRKARPDRPRSQLRMSWKTIG